MPKQQRGVCPTTCLREEKAITICSFAKSTDSVPPTFANVDTANLSVLVRTIYARKDKKKKEKKKDYIIDITFIRFIPVVLAENAVHTVSFSR